jgi:mannose-6-phosphate isomerase-like protein (cupin superfamily)
MITKSFLAKEYDKQKEGVFVKSLSGDQSQLNLIKLEKGQQIENESSKEQIGIILKGEVELKINERIYMLAAGDSYVLPMFSKYSFKVVGKEHLEYVEVYSPPQKIIL